MDAVCTPLYCQPHSRSSALEGLTTMRTQLNLVATLAFALITASATAESVYVFNAAAQFGTVNLSNGAFTPIGSGLPEGSAGLVQGPGGPFSPFGVSGDPSSSTPNPAAPP